MNQRKNNNTNGKEVQLKWRIEKRPVNSVDNALDDNNYKSFKSAIPRECYSYHWVANG